MLVTGLLYMWFKVLLICLATAVSATASERQTFTIDANNSLIMDKRGQWKVTRDNCTSCHSARLFKQQRLDRKGWLKVIRRMQKDEGLWPLGPSEIKIIDYLSRYYGTEPRTATARPRRALLRVKN